MMRISIIAARVNILALCTLLNRRSEHQVIWTAESGVEGIARCSADRPDLVLLDSRPPDLSAAEITRCIIQQGRCAVLLITACVNAHASRIFEAMGEGALDVVTLNLSGNADQRRQGEEVFLRKFRTIEKLCRNNKFEYHIKAEKTSSDSSRLPPLIVIGSSTGGPKALMELLNPLPKTFTAALVVVQHVNQEFSSGLVEWLSHHVVLPIRLACAGKSPQAGFIDVAGTNDHLILAPGLHFRYTPEPASTPYRPSVDVFFDSINQCWPKAGMAILLTGMGRDGARGLASLRETGWHTIAQDQASSVVYGMPKAAKELNAAVEILPLKKISDAMLEWATTGFLKQKSWI